MVVRRGKNKKRSNNGRLAYKIPLPSGAHYGIAQPAAVVRKRDFQRLVRSLGIPLVLLLLMSVPGVENSEIITGEADLLLTVRCRDMDEFRKVLLERIQAIEGITETKTMMVM